MSEIVDIRGCADHIEALQDASGAISWIEAGIWDAWNHGESAMALAIAGRETPSFKALDCLMDRQESDGGFTGDLGASVPLDESNRHLIPGEPETARDTNFTGYAAVTALRSLLALGALERLPRYWPMIQAAADFILDHQSRHGDIVWRASGDESLDDIDSLRAGNASLYKSLECVILAGRCVGADVTLYERARCAIGATLRENDARFDRFGTDRRRYAMDWYYPVLAGVLPLESARARLYARWREFVVAGLGCRCVTDEPWVTAAETAELALACISVAQKAQARTLLTDLAPLVADAGGYWMGWQFNENVIWPYERPSWTAGALVLAADALDELTPGSTLMVRNHVPELGPGLGSGVTASGEALPAFLRA